MLKTGLKLYFVLVIIGVIHTNVHAQDVRSANVTASIILEEVYNVEITSGEDISFVFKNKEQYDNGIVLNGITNLNLAANGQWQISMDSQGEDYFTSGNVENSSALDVSAISVKATNNESFVPLSSTSQVIYQSTTRGSNQELVLDYKANPSWETPKDNYVINIRYTIAAY